MRKLTRIALVELGFFAVQVAALAALPIAAVGCAESSGSGSGHVRVVKTPETAPPTGGIPPDKEADIQLLLQQRNPSTTKCYADVLNDKHDRAFKGSVIVLLTLQPDGHASDAQVIGGTLKDSEVTSCLVEKLKEFEYPQLPSAGSMQYTYQFEPAY